MTHEIALSLKQKAECISPNKLERFVKDEVLKKQQNWVNQLLSSIESAHPVLYRTLQPSELQVTYFLKTNSKTIKERIDELLNEETVVESKNVDLPATHISKKKASEAIAVQEVEIVKVQPKSALKKQTDLENKNGKRQAVSSLESLLETTQMGLQSPKQQQTLGLKSETSSSLATYNKDQFGTGCSLGNKRVKFSNLQNQHEYSPATPQSSC